MGQLTQKFCRFTTIMSQVKAIRFQYSVFPLIEKPRREYIIKAKANDHVAFAHHSPKTLTQSWKTQEAIQPAMAANKGTEALSASKGNGPHGKLNKIVLACSSGLDTPVLDLWLRENHDFESVYVSEDTLQAMVDVAREIGAYAVAHGCTVNGNDQGGLLEDPPYEPKKDMYKDAPDKPKYLETGIVSVIPVSLSGKERFCLLFDLNDIGGHYVNIDHINMVENLLIDMINHLVHKNPSGTILAIACPELEFPTLLSSLKTPWTSNILRYSTQEGGLSRSRSQRMHLWRILLK